MQPKFSISKLQLKTKLYCFAGEEGEGKDLRGNKKNSRISMRAKINKKEKAAW